MKHAKLFSMLVFIVVLGYGAVGFYLLPLATFQAELTRLGMLPESMFGWTKPQPAIDPLLMRQSSWQEADVLVLGDSFSDGRIWQTILTRSGLRVRTESWDSVRGICEDFMPWLRDQGFKGKYIVLEIVERNIVNGLDKSVTCKHMQFHPSIYADKPRKPPVLSFDPKKGNYSGRFSIGVKTQINIWEYERASRAPEFVSRELPNGARLTRVKNGCELFSHARCNDSLFLAEDRAEELPPNTPDTVATLNARLPGVTAIWAFVPNKSTAYLYPDKRFWDEVEKHVHAPNLLRMTQRAIRHKTVDLYPANNTHFSTTGYLLMGEDIFKTIQQTQPPQPR